MSFWTSFCDFPQKEQRKVLSLSSARFFSMAADNSGASATKILRRRYFRFLGKVMMAIQVNVFNIWIIGDFPSPGSHSSTD